MSKKSTFKGGVHLDGHKGMTSGLAATFAEVPERVYLPLSQHIGAPCVPLVVVGDTVKKGQRIGEGKGFVSSPIHASVSGTVVAIELKEHPGGSFVPCVVVENDRQETWAESVQPHPDPASLTPEQLRQLIFDAGIVGLGGATFPSHVKYSPVEGQKVEAIILNGVECEPFLTADHRLMLERPERIVAGLRYILRSTGAARGIIAIEDNKMDAVTVLRQAVAGATDLSVVVLAEKYPQGSEKQLIYACTGKQVPPGALPLAVGVVVNNVGTAAAIADAVELGRPMIERYVTVSGPGVERPANLIVRVGTLFSDLIEQCGGYRGEPERIIAGGPMMGKTVFTDSVPVVKGSSGIVVFNQGSVPETQEYTCVRCAKCVDACPAFLEPTNLVKLTRRQAWEAVEKGDVLSCIECGSCVYICPAKIPLIQYLRRAKQAVLAAKSTKAA